MYEQKDGETVPQSKIWQNLITFLSSLAPNEGVLAATKGAVMKTPDHKRRKLKKGNSTPSSNKSNKSAKSPAAKGLPSTHSTVTPTSSANRYVRMLSVFGMAAVLLF